MKGIIKTGVIATILTMLSGCIGMTGMPKDVRPVTDFDLSRYLGTWYEIARLDHSFERGLTDVSATYSMNEDGTVKVVNKGFRVKDDEWTESIGKAKFVDASNEGYLKVSFFGPFYGSYIIFGLDKTNYDYAFVSGPNLDYLWLLSRTKELDPSIIAKFKETAKAAGFDTTKLIMVEQKK